MTNVHIQSLTDEGFIMQDPLDELVFDQLSNRCALMEFGEISGSKGMVSPDLWYEIVPSERHRTFDLLLSKLVDRGLLPLEYIGFDRDRNKLYRKKFQ